MYTANLNTHWAQTHRQNLCHRLTQRMQSAQGDPNRLALLEQEASALGCAPPLEAEPEVSAPDRLTQTLQALAHLRVEH